MSLFAIWERILSYVQENDEQNYYTFQSELYPDSFSSGVFTIVVPADKPYILKWLKSRYTHQLASLITEASGTPATVQFILDAPKESAPEAPPAPVQTLSAPAPAPQPAPFPEAMPLSETPAPFGDRPLTPPIDVKNIRPKSLDEAELPSIEDKIRETRTDKGPEMSLFPAEGKDLPAMTKKEEDFSSYTFETFVYGNCNQMAYQAAFAVAEQIATDNYNRAFNPLFIYGPSGLGKTHLLHAIQNYLASHSRGKKGIYRPSESFVNELISAIGNISSQERFRKKYRNVDVLLLDDVQFFGKKDSSAMELFNTFNSLFDNKKNIVMTSDSSPENIRELEDRLKSRFASGLVVQISPPDFEICCAILERHAELEGVNLPRDVIEFIALHINKNIRELEGAYYSVKAYCNLMQESITLDRAREALKANSAFREAREVTMDLIIDTVCRQYDVPRSKLLGKSRPKNIVIPRQIAMYLCRTDLNEPYQSIADVFHKNDHTSVLQACRRVEKALDADPTMKKTLEHLRELLKK